MKRKLKENRVLFALAIVIVISLILIAIGLFKYFYGNDNSAYGDRLNGIEDHKISETIDSDIQSLFEAGVDSVKVDIKGKIIYIVMNVTSGVSKIDAESYAANALTKFSEEDLSFYDVQFLITCTTEEVDEKVFPIDGYKNSTSATIIW